MALRRTSNIAPLKITASCACRVRRPNPTLIAPGPARTALAVGALQKDVAYGSRLLSNPTTATISSPSRCKLYRRGSIRLSYERGSSSNRLTTASPFLSGTTMAPIEFNPPVLVSMGPDRTVRVVSSVAEAFECLSCVYWPRVAKRYSLEALHVCMQALHGYRTVESARLAFIAAAEAAEVLIVGPSRSSRTQPLGGEASAPASVFATA